MLDAGCWMLDAGCWMLDAGCWMLDAGCWMLDAGCGGLRLLTVVCPEFLRGDSGVFVVAVGRGGLVGVIFGKGMGNGETDFSPQRLERRRDGF
jgi:hypothetical protein